jgi:protein AbiQ
MNQNRLNLYMVNMKYIRNLHNADDNVLSVSPQTGKNTRPFIGIVIICDEKQYCIPLSSPKAKHKNMKNDVDFTRILDTNGKLIGVLDFNNMIPVRADLLKSIDIKITASDTPASAHYKNLLIDQLNFCRRNQDAIVNKANRLYRMVYKKNVSSSLKRRCLQFKKLEEVLSHFTS